MGLVRIQDSQRLASEQGAPRSYEAHITSEEEDLARPKRFTARSVHVANGDREEQKRSTMKQSPRNGVWYDGESSIATI